MPIPPVPNPTAAAVHNFTSPTTGHTYVLNSTATDFSTAAELCRALGPASQLISYLSPDEQYQVELRFTAAGQLMPSYSPAYWLGLRVPDRETWPHFRWLDGSPAPFNPDEQLGEYARWGYGVKGDGRRYWEPDSGSPPEYCVAANYSQLQHDDGLWGWSDERCELALPFICKVAGEQAAGWHGAGGVACSQQQPHCACREAPSYLCMR